MRRPRKLCCTSAMRMLRPLLTAAAIACTAASANSAPSADTAASATPAAKPHPAAHAAARRQAPPQNAVQVQVEHTQFHPMDGVILQVERMRGRMVGQVGHVISLDDKNSYSVQIDEGVTRLSAHDLTSLINIYLLRQKDSAIKEVEVTFDGEQVVLKGEVHKGVTLPFTGRGVLSATPEGDLRMHMNEFRVAGLLNKTFLALFGIHLDAVAEPSGASGYRVEGDDFITPLSSLFPPPRVYGHLTRVHIEGQDLVQVIGLPPALAAHHAIRSIPKALASPANYIYFTGGRMRFGKVTMDDVDLKLVDKTPETPFDFSLEHYQRQIQAGYVKVLPTLGLVVYAQDYAELSQGPDKHK